MIYAIDAHPFIWGVKKQSHENQTDFIRKAEEFFKWADYHKHIVLMPTVVVAEVLVPETDEEVDRYLKIIGDRFFVPDFDKNTAKIYSRILHGRMDEIKKNYQAIEITKQQMKIDHIIVATARAHRAESIVTYDNGLITFAKGIIRTDGLRDSYPFGDAPPPSLFRDL
ncbi:ferrochelatase [Dyadobacter sp. MSC1_007]|jgi:predicted nucleic acid-binding protein|uniref:DUF4411 family protein n=1 Tax=Dyadobacter sp. MSC1_007 TaxID=2909264 RepID=UPI0020306A7B|nr:DUF4411 family protein [Dyadobacter sp. MSC1_007]